MSFLHVTEVPGNLAHSSQLEVMKLRYEWAASRFDFAESVLEIACGAGMGIGILKKSSDSVHGFDIDPEVIAFGERTYKDREGIQFSRGDACDTGLKTAGFDAVVCFEAIYYFTSAKDFLTECHRLLKPGGKLLLSSVNCEWHGFNPSEHSVEYYKRESLERLAIDSGFTVDSSNYVVEDSPGGIVTNVTQILKRLGTKLGLIPKGMKGKALLKRIFYGALTPIPNELEPVGLSELPPLIDSSKAEAGNYKFYFIEASKA